MLSVDNDVWLWSQLDEQVTAETNAGCPTGQLNDLFYLFLAQVCPNPPTRSEFMRMVFG